MRLATGILAGSLCQFRERSRYSRVQEIACAAHTPNSGREQGGGVGWRGGVQSIEMLLSASPRQRSGGEERLCCRPAAGGSHLAAHWMRRAGVHRRTVKTPGLSGARIAFVL
jgi:hypothetical protein